MGIDSGVTIFVSPLVAFMCICVRECPTFGALLANYISRMAINLGLGSSS
jgi:hypothetical protein